MAQPTAPQLTGTKVSFHKGSHREFRRGFRRGSHKVYLKEFRKGFRKACSKEFRKACRKECLRGYHHYRLQDSMLLVLTDHFRVCPPDRAYHLVPFRGLLCLQRPVPLGCRAFLPQAVVLIDLEV